MGLMGGGRVPGALGSGGLSGIAGGSLVGNISATLVVYANLAKVSAKGLSRLARLGFKKAGTRLISYIKVGSTHWKSALVHIEEHFSRKALASKATHSVFRKDLCNRQALENLVKVAVKSPSAKRVSRQTFDGVPVGRIVFVIERQFAEDIGTEFARKAGQEVTETPCKVLRVILSICGRPITVYPAPTML